MKIDRRQFLQLTALGGGAVLASALPGCSMMPGAGEEADFYFVQLSDTHWGFNGPIVNPDARLLLVGSWSSRLPAIELPPNVIRRDYVPEDDLWRLLAACDAVVSLRWPTMGETSAAAVRALSVGKPLIVSDVGAFRELPDEVAIKVPVGDGEVEALAQAMRVAAGNEEMGAAARQVAETEHRLDRTADLYAEALRAASPAVAA